MKTVSSFFIRPVDRTLAGRVQDEIDRKTKPLGALGRLEKLALQIALIQNSVSPVLVRPHLLVFAGDHGIAREGVSAYPQDVTWQMVGNFLRGGAAINVFTRQLDLTLRLVDAGVDHDLPPHADLIVAKTGNGTKNFLHEPAMTRKECRAAVQQGARVVDEPHTLGCNVIGFGEMGIGNTSAAAAIMSRLCCVPVDETVGRGTGLDDAGLRHKRNVLRRALARHAKVRDPIGVLQTFGGFEMAQMCGAMLQAAAYGMVVLIDGFIATTVFLVASRLHPAIGDYAIFSHVSNERGHRRLLTYLGVEPVLDLQLRLGEGTGCALAYPVIDASVRFLNDMASFETAGVSIREQPTCKC